MEEVYLGQNGIDPSWDFRRYHVQASFIKTDGDGSTYRYLLLTVNQVAVWGHPPFMTIGRLSVHEGIGSRQIVDFDHLYLVGGGDQWKVTRGSLMQCFDDIHNDVGWDYAWTDVGLLTRYE
jgi:hypothetical protein